MGNNQWDAYQLRICCFLVFGKTQLFLKLQHLSCKWYVIFLWHNSFLWNEQFSGMWPDLFTEELSNMLMKIKYSYIQTLKAQYDFLIKILFKKAIILAITKLKYHSKLSFLHIFINHNNYLTFNKTDIKLIIWLTRPSLKLFMFTFIVILVKIRTI